jgi:hypothetical protein
MLLFPLILFIVALFTSTYKLILSVGDYVYTLALFAYFCISSYGLFNALVRKLITQGIRVQPDNKGLRNPNLLQQMHGQRV